jgi:hypothetical protein
MQPAENGESKRIKPQSSLRKNPTLKWGFEKHVKSTLD